MRASLEFLLSACCNMSVCLGLAKSWYVGSKPVSLVAVCIWQGVNIIDQNCSYWYIGSKLLPPVLFYSIFCLLQCGLAPAASLPWQHQWEASWNRKYVALGMFPRGVIGARLGQIEDSWTDYLAQGKQVRLLYLLLLLVGTLVSPVVFWLTASILTNHFTYSMARRI